MVATNYRVGKCQVCGRRAGIYQTTHVKAHVDAQRRTIGEMRTVIASHRFVVDNVDTGLSCEGAWMEPAADPALDRRRANAAQKRHAERSALVDPFRMHAAVALDAWIGAVPYSKLDLKILVQCALEHLTFGHAPAPPDTRRLPDEMLPEHEDDDAEAAA